MKKNFLLAVILISPLFSNLALATHSKDYLIQATPQPTTCITSAFSKTGSAYWATINLTLTNNCGASVDFQDAAITFNNADNLSGTTFWGNFYPMSYPNNQLVLLAQPNGVGSYLTTFSLHFPEESWANTKLANLASLTLSYGASSTAYDPKSVQVYLNSNQPPLQTGEIDLSNSSTQPAQVTQSYALVNLVSSTNQTTKVQVPWNSLRAVTGLAPGTYSILPENLSDSQGNAYQGTATPNSVSVTANQKVSSKLTYSQIIQTGSIKIQVLPLPTALQGYTGQPNVTFKRSDTGATTSKVLPWNTTSTVSQLANNLSYSLSTPNINANNMSCVGSFSPETVVSSATNPPTSQLNYQCTAIAQDKIPVSVSGLPNSINSLTLTFTPNTSSAPVTTTVTLVNGAGSGIVTLTDGTIYTVSTTPVPGYTATFNPQPLTATSSATEVLTFKQQSSSTGRIIGYLPGWNTPPAATTLANAGYTHILVAFGVFSTSSPGQITSAFDTVTRSYINSLHAAGIKVSLSLGGASSSVPNTTVNFHQVLSAASSASAFQQSFIQSVQNLITEYGFDGIDFDIEQGLNAGGTFTQPQGDIAVLAAIINQLHANNPNLLLSLAPQVANISATSGFDATWGNYASLVMHTAPSLSWVGIQLYNTGCAFGIDQVCYDPNKTNSPNFAVAMSTDLLANWPKTTASGQATGFQPYISNLNPSQVVIGFPAPNAQGSSDGSPVTPVSTIKRAILCLRTAKASNTSCDTYLPPKAYPDFGGVFDWEVVHDQANNFNFASGLKACVMNGVCT